MNDVMNEYKNHLGSKLDSQLLTPLTEILATSRTWLRVYEEISKPEIVRPFKVAGFDMALGLSQRAAQRLLIMELYNVFDPSTEKKQDIVSLQKIIQELKSGEYQFKGSDELDLRLKKINIVLAKEDSVDTFLQQLSESLPTVSKNEDLKKIFIARNKLVAHVNCGYFNEGNKESLPSIQKFEDLIAWADSLRYVIYKAYLPEIAPVDIYDWSESHSGNVAKLVKTLVGCNKS